MTNLTTTAINLLARNEGVHPAHMANRLALAIRVVDAANTIGTRDGVTATFVLTWALDAPQGFIGVGIDFRNDLARLAASVSGTLSDATLALALQIVEAN